MKKLVTRNKSHICDVCSRAFNTDVSLKRHIQFHHSKDDEPIICADCGEYFGNYAKMKWHNIIVHKQREKEYKCKFCNYTSYKAKIVKDYERTHTGEKPEICQWCGKGFSVKRTRENHELLHTGEKPFQCNFCDSSFVQRTSLNVHFQTHHKEYASDPSIKKYTRKRKSDGPLPIQ